MRVLSVGSMKGSSNTCLHRHHALERVADHVDMVRTDERPYSFSQKVANRLFQSGLPISLPDISNINGQIRDLVSRNHYDIVWIDKGLFVRRSTLEFVKKSLPKCKIVSYSPDNMALRHNQSQNYLDSLPLYDFVFTNKSYILDDMRRIGAKNIFFFNNMFEPDFHKRYELTSIEREELGGDVGFIGAWEKERADSLLFLAQNGVNVKVFGGGKWVEYEALSPNFKAEKRFLSDETYCKSLGAFRISLCFLRKMNYDLQTTRTMEIPACGGFMMAERTSEHLALFAEDREAVFFSDNNELLEKCRYYLSHEQERAQIAEAGYQRCYASGYSTTESIRSMIDIVMN